MQDEVKVTQADREAAAFSDDDAFREMHLLYNYADDDSRQFTRWQMSVAMYHGMKLAESRQQAERETLARMEAEIERLRKALDEIRDLHVEINPCNYDHDDACELNRQFCYAITVADTALNPPAPEAGQ